MCCTSAWKTVRRTCFALVLIHSEGTRAVSISCAVQSRGKVIGDRKSTRLNSSHLVISYAVFCLKKNAAFERTIISARSPYDRYPYDGDEHAITYSAKRGDVRLFSDRFFFNDTATTEIYTLSLHDALPISFQHAGAFMPLDTLWGQQIGGGEKD